MIRDDPMQKGSLLYRKEPPRTHRLDTSKAMVSFPKREAPLFPAKPIGPISVRDKSLLGYRARRHFTDTRLPRFFN